MQWVVDGYTLMLAALLLSAGSLSDRIGARRTFTTGMVLFVAASTACGSRPTRRYWIGSAHDSRSRRGSDSASSLSLIRRPTQTRPDAAA